MKTRVLFLFMAMFIIMISSCKKDPVDPPVPPIPPVTDSFIYVKGSADIFEATSITGFLVAFVKERGPIGMVDGIMLYSGPGLLNCPNNFKFKIEKAIGDTLVKNKEYDMCIRVAFHRNDSSLMNEFSGLAVMVGKNDTLDLGSNMSKCKPVITK